VANRRSIYHDVTSEMNSNNANFKKKTIILRNKIKTVKEPKVCQTKQFQVKIYALLYTN